MLIAYIVLSHKTDVLLFLQVFYTSVALLISLGAAITINVAETLIAALYFTLLVIVYSGDNFRSCIFNIRFDPTNNVLTFGIVGCWLGAFVIPLDWQKPYQNWPLPIIYGSFSGCLIGYLVGKALKYTVFKNTIVGKYVVLY